MLNSRIVPVSLSLLILSAMSLSACSEPEKPMRKISVTGQVSAPADASGKLRIRLYHAWALSGELRHPLEFITEVEAAANEPLDFSFDYPESDGEGLVAYAWLDTDGDDVLCTPTVRADLAGLSAYEDFTADELEIAVQLTENCRGPEWFYPPSS